MIRRLAACSVVAAVALATASSAAPPHIVDPRDDWKVPSQDILAGTLSTDRSGRVVATLKLAAALGEVPGSYHFGFYRGCTAYVAVVDWRGTTLPANSELQVYGCYGTLAPGVPDPRPALSPAVHPATATVAGDTVTWTLPALPELARGTRLEGAYSIVMPNPRQPVGFWNGGTHLPGMAVHAFDIAYSSRDHVVGH